VLSELVLVSMADSLKPLLESQESSQMKLVFDMPILFSPFLHLPIREGQNLSDGYFDNNY